MTRARDLADSADKDIAGNLTVDSLTVDTNIAVTGTVDGRDIATDGAKLDGIDTGATDDQTGAEIKAAYEAEANTNAFTDAEKTKLTGIETNATADQTGAEIKTAYEAEANTNAFTDAEKTKLTGIEASADVTDTANVTAAGALMTTGGSVTGDVSFGDNDKILLGNSNDLQIFHDGSQSYIKDVGTGQLRFAASDILFTNAAVTENIMFGAQDGAVTLYHNGASKLATTSSGVDVTGVITTDGMTTSADINFGDNDKAVFGAGSDLQIYHDGNNSVIQDGGTGNLLVGATSATYIQNGSFSKNAAIFNADGESSLHHNTNKKLATTSTGIDVTGTVTADGIIMSDNEVIKLGNSSDLWIYHNGGNSIISDQGTGDLYLAGDNLRLTNAALSKAYARGYNGGKFSLMYDNAEKLATTSYGVDISGSVVADSEVKNASGNYTPNFSTYQNFIWTLTGNVTFLNPTSEKTGQSGFFIFIHSGAGRTVSLSSDWETAGGAGLTLSSTSGAVDIVPYVVQSSGNILLGTPQLAFA